MKSLTSCNWRKCVHFSYFKVALPVADHQLSHSPFWAQSCEWHRLWESNPNKPAAAPASTAAAVQWPRVVWGCRDGAQESSHSKGKYYCLAAACHHTLPPSHQPAQNRSIPLSFLLHNMQVKTHTIHAACFQLLQTEKAGCDRGLWSTSRGKLVLTAATQTTACSSLSS